MESHAASDNEHREMDHCKNIGEMTEDYKKSVFLEESDGKAKKS
jgi:hypothetical protein